MRLHFPVVDGSTFQKQVPENRPSTCTIRVVHQETLRRPVQILRQVPCIGLKKRSTIYFPIERRPCRLQARTEAARIVPEKDCVARSTAKQIHCPPASLAALSRRSTDSAFAEASFTTENRPPSSLTTHTCHVHQDSTLVLRTALNDKKFCRQAALMARHRPLTQTPTIITLPMPPSMSCTAQGKTCSRPRRQTVPQDPSNVCQINRQQQIHGATKHHLHDAVRQNAALIVRLPSSFTTEHATD